MEEVPERGGAHMPVDSGTSPGMDAAARAELRRARQAVFGLEGPGHRPPAAFADRRQPAVGHPEPFVPAPNTPPLSVDPHDVVAARRDHPGALILGPESVPLPAAPALVCDGSDRIVRVNPALLHLAGRARGEGGAGLFGMRLPQLVVGPDPDARLVRPDGGLVRVRVLRWDVPGRELRAVVLVELGPPGADDAWGRRWVGELERMAEAGTWIFELATSALRRSPALEELYAALGGVPGADRAGPESEQVAQLCAALRAGAAPRHRVEVELAGGHRLDCRAEVEYAADGTPVRVVGIVRDLGARRAGQARSPHAAQRFAELLAILPTGMATIDPGGRILDVNPAMCRLLGAHLDVLRGRPIAAVAVDPTDARPVGALPGWLRLIRAGARHGYTVESVPLRRADGSLVWCELAVSVAAGDDGAWFWLLACTDLTEKRRLAEEQRRAARFDPVTALPLLPALARELGPLLEGPGRDSVAVVCAGVDDLDRVRTTLGHAAADEALATLAERLRTELPPGCSLARPSGDAFVVACADHGVVGLLADLGQVVVGTLGGGVITAGRPVRLAVSAGVAAAPPGRTTAAELLRHAEVARVEARRRGAGVVVATAELVRAAGTDTVLEADLRTALAGTPEATGLAVHFQPVVGPDGVVRGAEALLRWTHPEHGPVPPTDVVQLAARCGLLRELDLHVLRVATREAARWSAHDGHVASVAVNLSGLLPADPGFVAAVTDAVTAGGLAWNRLVLELVESSLVELPPHARAAMDELAARGVRFAVDDFGTGWSGLARLRELPAQVVKLDRSFVSGVAADPADRAIARTVLELAAVLGCEVVAEGVETPEQYRALRELGVELMQGWLFAKALPPAHLRALLVGDRLPVPS